MADDVKVEVSPEAAAAVPVQNEQMTPNPEVAEVVATVVETTPVINNNDTTLDEFEIAKGEAAAKPVVAKSAADVKPVVAAEIKPIVVKPADVKPTGRDYTGLPEALVPAFKRMSNDAFDAMKPVYLEKVRLECELKTIKESSEQPTKLPDSYLEHPLSYALAPEYEIAVNVANETKTVFDHWAAQLSAVNDGAATYKTLARDPKTGAIIYGSDLPVGKQTATQLLAFFNRTQAAAAQAEGKVSEIQQTYSQRHTEQKGQLAQMEKAMFGHFDDPKHPAQEQIKATIAELPAAFRNSPLAGVTAKALVTVSVLMKALTAERASKATAATAATKVAEAVKAAGPSATGVAATPQGAPVVTMDDFEKAKVE